MGGHVERVCAAVGVRGSPPEHQKRPSIRDSDGRSDALGASRHVSVCAAREWNLGAASRIVSGAFRFGADNPGSRRAR